MRDDNPWGGGICEVVRARTPNTVFNADNNNLVYGCSGDKSGGMSGFKVRGPTAWAFDICPNARAQVSTLWSTQF